MLWITVTSPSFFDGEASFIGRLLSGGADLVHLRKPGAAESDCARLLDKLTAEERKRIVIHDFFELAGPYGLRGIHLNARRGEIPYGYNGLVSRSCHSLEEVKIWKPVCSHILLSPVFDSISKQGYRAGFTPEVLRKASGEGIIDEKVIALGGVTPDKVKLLHSLGFGGAAMLGYVNTLANLPEDRQIMSISEIAMAFRTSGNAGMEQA